MDFVVDDLRDGYIRLLEEVLERGKKVSPRGMGTTEVLNATFTLTNPKDALPVGIGRRPRLEIGAAEALQLIGGFSDPEMMVHITGTFNRFMDGGILMGAYGPRLRTQMPSVVKRLGDDPDTRQANAFIADPLYDVIGQAPRDLPCTYVLHFFIREGKLDLIVNMRSNDLWKGLTYDAFQFTQMQLTVSNVLGIEVGTYYHHADSFHIYDVDVPLLERLHFTTEKDRREFAAMNYPIGMVERTMEAAQERAVRVWELDVEDPLATERWYMDLLRPHVRTSRTL